MIKLFEKPPQPRNEDHEDQSMTNHLEPNRLRKDTPTPTNETSGSFDA